MQLILIVDNDATQCTTLKNTIQKAFPNWKSIIAHCYSDAERLVEESIETNSCFTLFLLDIQLSGNQDNRDGYILAEYIRKKPEYYTTPMLFLQPLLVKATLPFLIFIVITILQNPIHPSRFWNKFIKCS